MICYGFSILLVFSVSCASAFYSHRLGTSTQRLSQSTKDFNCHKVYGSVINRSGNRPPPSLFMAKAVAEKDINTHDKKAEFLLSLENDYSLNTPSKERTKLLNKMIESKAAIVNKNKQSRTSTTSSSTGNPKNASFDPSSWESWDVSQPYGTWKVIYAPHISTAAGLVGGQFNVEYILRDDGTMTSHAGYDFPIVGQGYLSVSGTFSSVNEEVCRVDFDRAWVRRRFRDSDVDDVGPFPAIETVPNSFSKSVIDTVGRALFLEEFSVFPVSFLDEELIVFDFELLGTRICARLLPSS